MSLRRFFGVATFGLISVSANAQDVQPLLAGCGIAMPAKSAELLAPKRERLTIADVTGAARGKNLFHACLGDHGICMDHVDVDQYAFEAVRFERNDLNIPGTATFGAASQEDFSGKRSGIILEPGKRYRIFVWSAGLLDGEAFRISVACELP